MQMLTKIYTTPQSSLLFSYENTVIEGTSLRPVKITQHDEYAISLAQIDKLFQA